MMENRYLKWLAAETLTDWWCDSAVLADLRGAIENGAVGATTNPPLCKQALYADPQGWRNKLPALKNLEGDEKAEAIMRAIVVELAAELEPVFRETGGEKGYVCTQLNPKYYTDTGRMLANARRVAEWAPNVSIKLPVTASGLEVLEELVAAGIGATGTVSFSVSQVMEVRRRHIAGRRRAEQNGVKPGHCNAVIMVGRVDDYLRDMCADSRADILPEDLEWAGVACVKRAYALLGGEKADTFMMPAAFRGSYHITELSGAKTGLSTAMKAAASVRDMRPPFCARIEEPVPQGALDRLKALPEFCRVFEPDGMKPEDFVSFGLLQRTIAQFIEMWNLLCEFPL